MNEEWSINKQYAEAYFSMGWIPIPLCWPDENGNCACPKKHTNPKDIGKAPLMGKGYEKWHPGTVEEAVQYWDKYPNANIGILLEPSGLVLLDLDSPEAQKEALSYGLTENTPTVWRGYEREHRYFVNPGIECTRTTKQGKHKSIDILSLGYVVAPPSLHREGDLYDWIMAPEGFVFAGDLPEASPAQPEPWMVSIIKEAKQKKHAADVQIENLIEVNLDNEKLSEDLKRRIRYGTGPEMSDEDRAAFGDDRSRLVLSVMNSLMHRGWPDDKIASVLIDPQFAISERNLEKSNPIKYVASEIARARSSIDPMFHIKRDFTVIEGGLSESGPVEGTSALQPLPVIGASDNIFITNKYLQDISDEAWTMLVRKNSPPRFFQRNWSVTEVRPKDDGSAAIVDFDKDGFRGVLARNMLWIKTVPGRSKGEPARDVPTFPPKDVVSDMLAKPPSEIPIIHGVTYVPVFSRSGSLITAEGYHPDTKLFYAGNDLKIQDIPRQPSDKDIEAARRFFLDELYYDFPFSDDASRANTMAATLLPFVRPMINSPTPLHLFDAPTSGTGKTLLATLIGELSTGRPIATISGGKNDEEWDKRILSLLRIGSPVILFDNLEHGINFPSLNNAVTSTMFSARILGRSEIVEFPNLATWLLTGNNVDVSGDVLRRICWIRLDAKSENPTARQQFKRGNIKAFLHHNRAHFIWAALVLVQNWIAAGCPPGKERMGSFESWSSVMGGILELAGIPGFLTNADVLREKGDPEMDEWRAFIQLWWEAQNSTAKQVSTEFMNGARARPLLNLAQEHQLLTGKYSKGNTEASRLSYFQKALHEKTDSIIEGKQIIRKKWNKFSIWHLQEANQT